MTSPSGAWTAEVTEARGHPGGDTTNVTVSFGSTGGGVYGAMGVDLGLVARAPSDLVLELVVPAGARELQRRTDLHSPTVAISVRYRVA